MSGALSLRMFIEERITESGEVGITSDVGYNHDPGTPVMLAVIFMAADELQSPRPSSWTREARVAYWTGNVAHSLRLN